MILIFTSISFHCTLVYYFSEIEPLQCWMLNNLGFLIQVPYAEYHGSASFGAFAAPRDLVYSSVLTPGDPYSYNANQTSDPSANRAGQTLDPSANRAG